DAAHLRLAQELGHAGGNCFAAATHQYEGAGSGPSGGGVVIRHPEVAAAGGPRRMHGPGRRPSRLAALAPQGDGLEDARAMTDRPEPPHPIPLPVGGREESGRLAQNIVYFARALRAAGIPVGPGSVLAALEAVQAAGVGTRDDFYWTLHAVFVKRHEHSVLFDQAFRIFFRRRGS